MLINGEWLLCDDGIIRPSVSGLVRVADGQYLEVTFLIDSGADRTVFSSRFFHRLQPLETSDEQILLAGVGGQVNSITVSTSIGFMRDDGRLITVRGHFGVFTESESAEMAVLGRDVTNNFSVLYDYPAFRVALLSSPHYCEIRKTT